MKKLICFVLLLTCVILSGCDTAKNEELFDDHSAFVRQVKSNLGVPEEADTTYTISSPEYNSEYDETTVKVVFVENNQNVAQARCLTRNGALVGDIKIYSSEYPTKPEDKEIPETPKAPEPPELPKSAYLTYKNSRYGYTVQYPSDFIPGEEAGNGDGRKFVSYDGTFSLTCWGSHTPGVMLNDACSLDAYYEYVLANLDYVPTFKNKDKGKEFFVFSGYKGENIIYDKYILKSDKTDNVIRMVYPTAMKEAYDDMVTHISHNFFSGAGVDSTVTK